jgi:hypothetical protein
MGGTGSGEAANSNPHEWLGSEGAYSDLDGTWNAIAGRPHMAANYTYLGPCLAAAEVAAREAAAAEAMRETCAAEMDCGCAARPDVLARLAESGRKRASYLCPHGDVCCALASVDLQTTPLPVPDALARVRAEAECAGMERAVKVAIEYGHTDDGDVLRIVAMIVNAIRAAAQEIKP